MDFGRGTPPPVAAGSGGANANELVSSPSFASAVSNSTSAAIGSVVALAERLIQQKSAGHPYHRQHQSSQNYQHQQHQEMAANNKQEFSLLDSLIVATAVSLILISIVGNCLVCVAIFTDRKLRKLGNAFIVSLAIADLFVSCLVMTFALCNDLMGHWIFGDWFCDVWISFDVMCSTASILNLCAISLDRYHHIKNSYLYDQRMTRRVAISAVVIIWLISGLVSFVPINLGWHKPDHFGMGSIGTTSSPLSLSPSTATNLQAAAALAARTSPALDSHEDGEQHGPERQWRQQRRLARANIPLAPTSVELIPNGAGKLNYASWAARGSSPPLADGQRQQPQTGAGTLAGREPPAAVGPIENQSSPEKKRRVASRPDASQATPPALATVNSSGGDGDDQVYFVSSSSLDAATSSRQIQHYRHGRRQEQRPAEERTKMVATLPAVATLGRSSGGGAARASIEQGRFRSAAPQPLSATRQSEAAEVEPLGLHERAQFNQVEFNPQDGSQIKLAAAPLPAPRARLAAAPFSAGRASNSVAGQDLAAALRRRLGPRSMGHSEEDALVPGGAELEGDVGGRQVYKQEIWNLAGRRNVTGADHLSSFQQRATVASSAPATLLSASQPDQQQQLPLCMLTLTPTYAVISSTISFYIPCVIMLGLYIKLFACARRHVRSIQEQIKVPAQLGQFGRQLDSNSSSNSNNNNNNSNSLRQHHHQLLPLHRQQAASAIANATATSTRLPLKTWLKFGRRKAASKTSRHKQLATTNKQNAQTTNDKSAPIGTNSLLAEEEPLAESAAADDLRGARQAGATSRSTNNEQRASSSRSSNLTDENQPTQQLTLDQIESAASKSELFNNSSNSSSTQQQRRLVAYNGHDDPCLQAVPAGANYPLSHAAADPAAGEQEPFLGEPSDSNSTATLAVATTNNKLSILSHQPTCSSAANRNATTAAATTTTTTSNPNQCSNNKNAVQVSASNQYQQQQQLRQQLLQRQSQQRQQQQQKTTHKAAVTLGIIMGTFLFCWVPFFCLNIIKAFCVDCIPSSVFRFFTWLGYVNSALNPIIYGIHNTEFRCAFNRIFFKHLNIKNSRYYLNRRSSYDVRRNSRASSTAATATVHQTSKSCLANRQQQQTVAVGTLGSSALGSSARKGGSNKALPKQRSADSCSASAISTAGGAKQQRLAFKFSGDTSAT